MKIHFTLVLLILLTLPTLLPYFNSQFFYTQDHIFIARLQQMSTALSDGHFPVRWAPDLRYGEPIYNFYAPLPYYLGAAIKLLGFNFIWVAKILFITSSILSAIAMYILCRKLFGVKAAFLATALYTYAPYRAVDLYVRGALSEAWAFVFFPLIFYASVLISERNSLSEKVSFKGVSILSIALAGLFLTHNVTTLMFIPFLFLWWVHLLVRQKNWKLVFPLAGSFILGLVLSAFFLLPALFERGFIQTKYLTVGYFDFRAHFVALYQFFSPVWGYGSSLWGPVDDMSFQVGLSHWATLILALIVGIFYRKDKKLFSLLFFLASSFFLSIFMQHNKSAFLWEAIPITAFIQFPWRFLAISVFIVAITGGAIAGYLKNKFAIVYFILFAGIIFVNFQYFRPRNFVEDAFFDKFLNVESMRAGVDLTKDYLPIWVVKVEEKVFNSPRVEEGKIDVGDSKRETTLLTAQIKVLEDSLIEMPITYFPGWEVLANGQVIDQESPSQQGLIRFKLKSGDYDLRVHFKDTPIRTTGNIVSLASLILLFGFWGYKTYKGT